MKYLRWRIATVGLLAALLGYTLPQQINAQETYSVLLPVVFGRPQTVRVDNIHAARDATGTLYVTGETVNDLAEIVYLTNVTVRAFDEANQLVATNSEHALLIHTPPDGRNPFRVALPDAPDTTARYDISLEWSLQNRSDFRTLTLLDEQFLTTNGLEVRGTIRNNDKKTIREGRIAITFYDEQGRVVDAEYANLGAERVTSGSTATYIIRTGRSINYSRYEIRAEGTIAPE